MTEEEFKEAYQQSPGAPGWANIWYEYRPFDFYECIVTAYDEGMRQAKLAVPIDGHDYAIQAMKRIQERWCEQ